MRRLKRYELIAFLAVWDRQSGECVGHLVNITAEGVGMTCPGPLDESKTYEFTVELPSQILGFDSIDVDADCSWMRKNEESELLLGGFLFLAPTVDVVEVIEELIRLYQR